jgi:hypothetical protein
MRLLCLSSLFYCLLAPTPLTGWVWGWNVGRWDVLWVWEAEALMCWIVKSWAYEPDLWAISERMPIHTSSQVLGMVCLFCFSVHLPTGNSHLLLFTFDNLIHFFTWWSGPLLCMACTSQPWSFFSILKEKNLYIVGCVQCDIWTWQHIFFLQN